MENLALVRTLRATLAELATALQSDKEVITETDLRQEVDAVVDEMRRLGWPPERVIVTLKGVCEEAGLHYSDRFPTSESEIGKRDGISVLIIGWCIDRYYRSAE